MRDERTMNYYAVLELSPTATEAEIKRAWHEHMQVWHPDRFVHSPTLHRKAEARTQLINQAYQTLSDPVARTRYDSARQQTSSGTPFPSTIALASSGANPASPSGITRAANDAERDSLQPSENHGTGHSSARRYSRTPAV